MERLSRLSLMALAIFAAASIIGAGNVMAQSAQSSSATLGPPGATDISMFLVPNGSGTPFTYCFEWGGSRISAVIEVNLRLSSGLPVMGVPASSVRLEEAGSTVTWCDDTLYPPPAHAPNLADGPSGPLGRTEFTLAYHGGGWDQAPTWVWLWETGSGTWQRIPSPLNVSYNSPDINGDLIVNLSDVAFFAADFFSVGYSYRSDFNYDGLTNLTDLAMFASTLGAGCP